VACFVALVAALPWMINMLVSFAHNLFSNIPTYIK
jgi:flagellar biosynthesis protein FliQ